MIQNISIYTYITYVHIYLYLLYNTHYRWRGTWRKKKKQEKGEEELGVEMYAARKRKKKEKQRGRSSLLFGKGKVKEGRPMAGRGGEEKHRRRLCSHVGSIRLMYLYMRTKKKQDILARAKKADIYRARVYTLSSYLRIQVHLIFPPWTRAFDVSGWNVEKVWKKAFFKGRSLTSTIFILDIVRLRKNIDK